MYKNNLEQLITKNSVPSSFFLFGNSNYFIDTYIEKIKKLSATDAQTVSFYFNEYDFTKIKESLSHSSLFSSSNIVVVKINSNIPKKEIESLIEATTKSQNNKFILAYYGDDKHTKSIQSSFVKAKEADFVRFFTPTGNELYYVVKEICKTLEVDIDEYALKALMSMQNSNLSFIESELKKLSIYDKPIDFKMVESMVYGLETSDVEDIVVKILNKTPYEEDFAQLLEKTHIDEIKFLSTTHNYIVMILMFHIYIKVHGSLNVIKVLGHPLPPKLVEQRSSIAFRLNEKVLQKMLAILMESEFQIKTQTNIDKKAILLSTLIKLKASF